MTGSLNDILSGHVFLTKLLYCIRSIVVYRIALVVCGLFDSLSMQITNSLKVRGALRLHCSTMVACLDAKTNTNTNTNFGGQRSRECFCGNVVLLLRLLLSLL